MVDYLRNRLRGRKDGNFIRRKLPEGGEELVITPALKFRPVTLGLIEKVSPLLGLDADLVLMGDVDLERLDAPPLSDVKKAVNLLLYNGKKYDLDNWSPALYETFLGYLLGNFMSRLYLG
jgi:hypothetical protein